MLKNIYIRYPLPCNRLPQTQGLEAALIHYLTVSADQESKHSLAGLSAGLQPRPGQLAVSPGLWTEEGRVCVQAHSVRRQNSFPCSCRDGIRLSWWLEARSPRRLMARVCLNSSRPRPVLCCVGSLIKLSASSKPTAEGTGVP